MNGRPRPRRHARCNQDCRTGAIAADRVCSTRNWRMASRGGGRRQPVMEDSSPLTAAEQRQCVLERPWQNAPHDYPLLAGLRPRQCALKRPHVFFPCACVVVRSRTRNELNLVWQTVRHFHDHEEAVAGAMYFHVRNSRSTWRFHDRRPNSAYPMPGFVLSDGCGGVAQIECIGGAYQGLSSPCRGLVPSDAPRRLPSGLYNRLRCLVVHPPCGRPLPVRQVTDDFGEIPAVDGSLRIGGSDAECRQEERNVARNCGGHPQLEANFRRTARLHDPASRWRVVTLIKAESFGRRDCNSWI
jgi:hypothetical protein